MQDCDHQTLLLFNYEATAGKNPKGACVSKRNIVLNSDEDTNFISSFHGCKEEKEKGLTTTISLLVKCIVCHCDGTSYIPKSSASKYNPICGATPETGLKNTGWKSQQTNKNTAFSLWRYYIKFKLQSNFFNPSSFQRHTWKIQNFFSVIIRNPSVLGRNYLGASRLDFNWQKNNIDHWVMDSNISNIVWKL